MMFMPCPPVSYYSGCGGNSNRYRTKAECRRRCFAHMANTTKDVTDEERSEPASAVSIPQNKEL